MPLLLLLLDEKGGKRLCLQDPRLTQPSPRGRRNLRDGRNAAGPGPGPSLAVASGGDDAETKRRKDKLKGQDASNGHARWLCLANALLFSASEGTRARPRRTTLLINASQTHMYDYATDLH